MNFGRSRRLSLFLIVFFFFLKTIRRFNALCHCSRERKIRWMDQIKRVRPNHIFFAARLRLSSAGRVHLQTFLKLGSFLSAAKSRAQSGFSNMWRLFMASQGEEHNRCMTFFSLSDPAKLAKVISLLIEPDDNRSDRFVRARGLVWPVFRSGGRRGIAQLRPLFSQKESISRAPSCKNLHRSF